MIKLLFHAFRHYRNNSFHGLYSLCATPLNPIACVFTPEFIHLFCVLKTDIRTPSIYCIRQHRYGICIPPHMLEWFLRPLCTRMHYRFPIWSCIYQSWRVMSSVYYVSSALHFSKRRRRSYKCILSYARYTRVAIRYAMMYSVLIYNITKHSLPF